MKKEALRLIVEKPLTLKELSEMMNIKEKKAFNLLKSLFEAGEITQFKDQGSQRRYRSTGTTS